MMNEAAYRTWHQLHIRAASRQPLTPAEKVAYEAGLQEMHAQETLGSSYEADIRLLQARIAESEQERARLNARRLEIEAKIAALEAAQAARIQTTSEAGEARGAS